MVVTDSKLDDAVRPTFLTFGGEVEEGEPFAHMIENRHLIDALVAKAKELGVDLRAGTVSGLYNMGSVLGTMILQPAIGWLLDLSWRGTIAGGVRIYALAAYRSGFVLIIAFSILSALAIGFTTETHCRQQGAPDRNGAANKSP